MQFQKQKLLGINLILCSLIYIGTIKILSHGTEIKESRYGDRPVIASLSLGQTRKFDFRKLNHHQSKYSIPLPHESLLMMKGDLQEHWEHHIAKSTLHMKERINLTFRLVSEI